MPMTPQQCLEEACRALHEFQTGRRTVEVEFQDRKVRYNRTNPDELRAYIGELEAQIAGRTARRGAIGFLF